MSSMSDDSAPENLPGPEHAPALRDRASELYAESARLGHEADLLLAQSEMIAQVLSCRIDLEHAESGLADARTQLADATAAYEPVARQLEEVRQQLAEHTDDAADETVIDTIPLADRLNASAHRLALEHELARLEPVAASHQAAVRNASDLIASYERDSLPTFRVALADAEKMLADPPLGDFSQLVAAAPVTAMRRTSRMGLILLYLIAGDDSPHAASLRGAVYSQLKLTGYLDGLHDEWLRDVLRKVDPGIRADVLAALKPPDRRALPDRTQPASPADVVRSLRGGWDDVRQAGADRLVQAAERNAARNTLWGPGAQR